MLYFSDTLVGTTLGVRNVLYYAVTRVLLILTIIQDPCTELPIFVGGPRRSGLGYVGTWRLLHAVGSDAGIWPRRLAHALLISP